MDETVLNSKFRFFIRFFSGLSLYSRLRLGALLLTLVFIGGHHLLPAKRVQLHPQENFDGKLYGYTHPISGRSVSWIDKQKHYWECRYLADHLFGCGFSVAFDPEYVNGLDLTTYRGLEFHVRYEGPAQRLRFFLRNYNDNYSVRGDGGTSKYMSLSLRESEVNGRPVFIALEEFTVADWWLKNRDIRRQWSAPEFSNITEIGVDHPQNGVHRTRVEAIYLLGEWLDSTVVLTVAIVFWVVVFLLEGIYRFYLVHKNSLQKRLTVNELEDQQLSLESEKASLESLYQTDPLTAVGNRAGLTSAVIEMFGPADTIIGVILLDIDHFKSVNDRYGHDKGDQVLKTVAALLKKQVTKDECVARWGGEEFVLLTRVDPSVEVLSQSLDRAEQLRLGIAKMTFDDELNLKLTASIGLSWREPGEPFETVFKRADNALYKAKTGGRNCVKWER